ncbi:MAG: Thioesterase superfamily [Frankiales bacterium]|nr:Thioesterase superfamily [Frankiales bacterium]
MGAVTTPVQVRFGDLDALGHVNNVQFFRFMETARVRWFDQAGPRMHALVARSECDHRAEIGSRVRTVDVTVSVESLGRTSFVLLHELTVEGEPVATGRVVMVKVGDDRRPAPLTDEERALLSAG